MNIDIDIDSMDRRSWLLILTDDGRQTLAAAVPIWRGTHSAIEEGFPTVDASELRAALGRCKNIARRR